MDLPPIDHQVYVDAPMELVFKTLTTAAGWDAWFTQGTLLDARKGGNIRFRWVNWGPEHVITEDGGPILEIIPSHKFVFIWQPDEHPTTVSINLSTRGEGTIVQLQDSGYTTPEVFMYCAAGWGEALTLLKFYLEHNLTYGIVPE